MNKKICLVTCGDLPVPAVQGGAVETLLTLLAKQNEIEKKIDLSIISIEYDEARKQALEYQNTRFYFVRKNTFFENKLELLGRLLNKFSKIIRHDEIQVFSFYYKRCYSITKKINADYIVMEGGPIPAAFSVFRKKGSSRNLVLHLHGNWFPSNFVSNLFENVICVSQFVENEYMSTCTNKNVKINTVYNCIDTAYFDKRISPSERIEIRAEYNFLPEDFIVVYCGRISPEKGIDNLIRAIVKCPPNIKLLIIGSPHYGLKSKNHYLNKVIQLVEANRDKIKYTGYIKNQELYKYYQAGDCLSSPALWEEPAGIVNIEAEASGLPIVTTISGGTQEYTTEETAVWLEKDAALVDSLAAIFSKLSKDKPLCMKMSIAAVEQSKKFSEKFFYASYLECFK